MGGSKATAGVFLNEVLIGQVQANRGQEGSPGLGSKEDSVLGRVMLQLKARFIWFYRDVVFV